MFLLVETGGADRSAINVQLPNGTVIPVSTGDSGEMKLGDILATAGLTDANGNPDKDKIKTSDKPKVEGIWVQKPDGTSQYFPIQSDGTLDNGGKDFVLPAGSTVRPIAIPEPKKILPFVFKYNDNGYEKTVTVEVETAHADSATWDEIKAAADASGIELIPAGYDLKELKQNGTEFKGTTNPLTSGINNPIDIRITKNASYKIVYDPTKTPIDVTFDDVPYPDPGQSLKDIFAKGKVDTNTSKTPASDHVALYLLPGSGNVFTGWTVTGSSELYKPSEIDNNKRANGTELPKFKDGTIITAKIDVPHYIRLGSDPSDPLMEFTEIKGFSVGDFYIQNTEVTRAQWKAVMLKDGKDVTDSDGWYVEVEGKKYKRISDTRYDEDGTLNQWTAALSTGNDQDMNMPMNFVSWYDAVMFCNMLSLQTGKDPYYYYVPGKKGSDSADPPTEGQRLYDPKDWIKAELGINKLYTPTFGRNLPDAANWGRIYCDEKHNGYRLPTLEEWKYAAHGGNVYGPYPKYSGTTGSDNNDLKKVAWTSVDAGGKVHPVGERGGDYPVRDMSGNVWEWTMDEDEANSENNNIKGYTHVYKGGAFDAPAKFAEIDDTTGNHYLGYYGKTGDRSQGIGFRIMEYKTRN